MKAVERQMRCSILKKETYKLQSKRIASKKQWKVNNIMQNNDNILTVNVQVVEIHKNTDRNSEDNINYSVYFSFFSYKIKHKIEFSTSKKNLMFTAFLK